MSDQIRRPGDKGYDAFKAAVREKLMARHWTVEKYEHMVGFGYHAEIHFSGGTPGPGSQRAGLVDERVMWKYPTGSRHVVVFLTAEEALAFWTECTGLPVFPYEGSVKISFPRRTIVRILSLPEEHVHERWNKSPIGLEVPVLGTLTAVGSDKVCIDLSRTGLRILSTPAPAHPDPWWDVAEIAVPPTSLEFVRSANP